MIFEIIFIEILFCICNCLLWLGMGNLIGLNYMRTRTAVSLINFEIGLILYICNFLLFYFVW